MVAGLAGCGTAQLLGTTVPYAVYGIAASAVVLLLLTARASAEHTPTTPREIVSST
jgi:SSS family solute:Na+ symporter